jgi:puromycin-sensitive aminopeptidase
MDALFRSTVIGGLGRYGDLATAEEARRRFQRMLESPSSLHPDLRAVVYGLAAQTGDRSTYDAMWRLYHRASLHEEKMRLLGAITRFEQPELIADLLARSMDDEQVRAQDAPLVLVQVAMNREGRDMAWDFMRDQWEEIDRRYGKGGFAIMRLVQATGSFTTLQRADEVDAFFKAHSAPSAARTIQQSLERIRLNARWLERNGTEVADWLAARA